ncbi:UNVERIFIED_CONTAM: hypothetical protein RMT77_017718 [Armadillidium vulgare]
MGSSKKKDKDRERKKRKRDRSSSRSRDHKEKHHKSRHHKHKKHKRLREERSPSISLSDLSDLEPDFEPKKTIEEPVKIYYNEPSPTYTPPMLSPPPPPEPSQFVSEIYDEPKTSGNEISLSIEETNKIRAKLGLKPLQMNTEVIKDDGGDSGPDIETIEYKPGEAIHKPAENLRDKIEVEKLREKIAAQREKRRLKDKMSKVKNLGDSEEEEDVSSWVSKNRALEKERKAAELRSKMLEELDEQFGVGELVEEEMVQTKKKMYDSKNLSGLRVQHAMDRFSEGQTTILTLKDSSILDAEEDTLVNVNIQDMERVEKNLKLKKAKPNEADYDAPDVDEYGNIVMKTVLTKYDEEIIGEKKKSFRIGRRGEAVNIDEPLNAAQKMAKLRKLATLDMPVPQLATEYYTPEEMVSFKKVKKKRKKKKILTADDLEPIHDNEVHWGSRNSRVSMAESMEVDPSAVSSGGRRNRIKTLRELMEEDDDIPIIKTEKEETPADHQDEDSEGEKDTIELQEALTRSRRAKLNATNKHRHLDSIPVPTSPPDVEMEKEPGDDTAMTLNLTDEFCRSLGDIPTYGLSGNRADEDAVVIPEDAPQQSKNSFDTQGAWEEVGIENTKVEINNERSVPILEEEPDTAKGVVNALKLALKKGYLEKNNDKKPVNATLQHLRAVHYSIEDKAVEEDRRGNRGNDRYMGPVMDFREKETYKPDVKLEYVDDEGRKLNAKEAFRYLSHKFHGKGSGKNKLEKRMKKWQEELIMKHMSSSDTPLQTLERQREKQKQLGAAYLVLSGSKTQEALDVKK